MEQSIGATKRKRWQTIAVDACIVQQQQGFICERHTIKTQDICLDTEQNIRHFEVHPHKNPETVLVHTGKGRACMRTVCDSILADNITVATNNHSNICNFTESIACDFSYAAPVTTQLLQSDYELIHNLPTPMGMDLTLLKKLLRHDDLH